VGPADPQLPVFFAQLRAPDRCAQAGLIGCQTTKSPVASIRCRRPSLRYLRGSHEENCSEETRREDEAREASQGQTLIARPADQVAWSLPELIAFRAIQGLGGGGLIVTTMAVIGDIVSPRDRGRYQGFFGAVFGLATVIGPLLGGFFVEQLSWRWIFYINLPLGLIALAVINATFKPPQKHSQPPAIDYAGAGLLTGALTGIVLITSLGGTLVHTAPVSLFALVLVSAVALIAFVRVEYLNPQAFPFDKIKIDRCFVQDLARGSHSSFILKAVVGLAANLGMATTAEGVETAEQLATVPAEGCTEVQGYYFSAPRSAHEVPTMLETIASKLVA
jgi:MFS family permease